MTIQPEELVQRLTQALDEVWRDNRLFSGREDAITAKLTEVLQCNWQCRHPNTPVCFNHTYRYSTLPDHNGMRQKEIKRLFPALDSTKHIIPDIILHEADTQENNLFVLEVKKSKNHNRSGRIKDVETLCALVGADRYYYRYGCSLEINETEAFAVWFCRDDIPVANTLPSFFYKGITRTSASLLKACSGEYYLFTESSTEVEKALHFVRSYDPARVHIVSNTPVCRLLGNAVHDWAVDSRDGNETICHPILEMERIIEPPERRRTCMLMVTHRCNLNCVYCYEKFKDEGEMDFETAKRAILAEAHYVREHTDMFDELEIDFMGGELMAGSWTIAKGHEKP